MNHNILSLIVALLPGYSVIVRSVCKAWRDNYEDKKSSIIALEKDALFYWVLEKFGSEEMERFMYRNDVYEIRRYFLVDTIEALKYDAERLVRHYINQFANSINLAFSFFATKCINLYAKDLFEETFGMKNKPESEIVRSDNGIFFVSYLLQRGFVKTCKETLQDMRFNFHHLVYLAIENTEMMIYYIRSHFKIMDGPFYIPLFSFQYVEKEVFYSDLRRMYGERMHDSPVAIDVIRERNPDSADFLDKIRLKHMEEMKGKHSPEELVVDERYIEMETEETED